MTRYLFPCLVLAWCFHGLVHATELGTRDTHFTINGKRTFLLGVSYYAALGASTPQVQKDLNDMQRDGFNWIRVWGNWGAFGTNISAVKTDGTLREPFFGRLQSLIAECDKRGMIVDVTLARENGAKEPPGMPSLEAHSRAVVTLIEGLRRHRNWYLDLANERNIRDKRHVSQEDLRIMRDLAKGLDEKRLITASHSSDDEDLIRHVEPYLNAVRLDFIATHRNRSKGSSQETAVATVMYHKKLSEMNLKIPLHYQEPFRRGYEDWEPSKSEFLTDLKGAIDGGAAGWCFHNGSQRRNPDQFPRRSFDLRDKRLYDQLDSVEQEVVKAVKAIVTKE